MTDRLSPFVEEFGFEDNAELRMRHFEVFDEIRQRKPVIYASTPGYWMLTSMEGIHEALQRCDLFGNGELSVMKRNREGRVPYKLIPSQLDAPEHTVYRRILNPLLSPGTVKKLEPEIRQAARRVTERIMGRGRCEFMDDVARPLVAEVFLHLFGLPIAERERFFRLVQTAFIPPDDDRDGAGVRAAVAELHDVLRTHMAERRAAPSDDLLSALVHATVRGEPIGETELLNLAQNVLLGGLETTTAVLGYFIRHFAQRPDLQDRLHQQPQLLPTAVEEILRLYSPVSLSRVVLEDTEFQGCPMKADDRMVLPLAAANRDHEQFEKADEFRLDRGPTRHIAFGIGPHRCVGSHLARLELVTALREWHSLIPRYRLAPEVTMEDVVLGLSGPVRVDIIFDATG